MQWAKWRCQKQIGIFAGIVLGTIGTVAFIPAYAQPTSAEMLEQLRPRQEPTRTRGLRNLMVESVPESSTAPPTDKPAVGQAKPSLSLLIQFDVNSASIRLESDQALANLSAALRSTELANSSFVIEGHTDASGSAEGNRKLSLRRAESVKDRLVTSGVPEARLTAVGKGASELAIPGSPRAPENRRVKIVVSN